MGPLTQAAVTLLYWVRVADRLRQKGLIIDGPRGLLPSDPALADGAHTGIFPRTDDAAIRQSAEAMLAGRTLRLNGSKSFMCYLKTSTRR